MRAAVEAPPHHPPRAAEGVELGEDLLLERGELAARIDLDAGVEARRENHSIGQRRPEACWDGEPVLRVQVVLVLTAKCQPWGPLVAWVIESVRPRRLSVWTGVVRWEEPRRPGPWVSRIATLTH